MRFNLLERRTHIRDDALLVEFITLALPAKFVSLEWL